MEEEPESLKVEALGIGGHVDFRKEASMRCVLTEALQDLEFFQEEDRRLFQFLCRMNGDFHGKGAGIACEDELSGALCGALNIARYQEDGSKKDTYGCSRITVIRLPGLRGRGLESGWCVWPVFTAVRLS